VTMYRTSQTHYVYLTHVALSVHEGQGFYGCQSETSWVQCPVTCAHKFDNLGCFQCLCKEQLPTETGINMFFRYLQSSISHVRKSTFKYLYLKIDIYNFAFDMLFL